MHNATEKGARHAKLCWSPFSRQRKGSAFFFFTQALANREALKYDRIFVVPHCRYNNQECLPFPVPTVQEMCTTWGSGAAAPLWPTGKGAQRVPGATTRRRERQGPTAPDPLLTQCCFTRAPIG